MLILTLILTAVGFSLATADRAIILRTIRATACAAVASHVLAVVASPLLTWVLV